MKRIVNIDIDTFEGTIPSGEELIIFEKGETNPDNTMILLGFDEVGEYDHMYKNPSYGFLRQGRKRPKPIEVKKDTKKKRFIYGDDRGVVIDTITGKTTKVPLFALRATLEALNELFD